MTNTSHGPPGDNTGSGGRVSRFARAARRAREDLGLSQQQVADLMHAYKWTQSTVSKTELGDRPVTIDEADELARVLGQDIAWMLYAGSDADTPEQARIRRARADLVHAARLLDDARAELRIAEIRYAEAREEAAALGITVTEEENPR